MEQQHRYSHERQYAAFPEHFIQPAWLCMPQIKIENDLDVYHCLTPQYDTSSNHSGGSVTDISQNSLDCIELHNRNGSLLNVSLNDYSHCSRVSSALDHDNASYAAQNDSFTAERSSTEAICHSSCLDQGSTDSRYLLTDKVNEERSAHIRTKTTNKTDNVVPWYAISRQNERLPLPDRGSRRQQIYSTSPRIEKGKVLKKSESDEYESKQAFDLTCRNRRPSKEDEEEEEEGSSNDSQLKANDESLNLQPQAGSSPKHQTCKICGKVLSSPSSYYVHMKVHSGNKPYACTVCEASFCRKPYLEVHMRTHTGERPFECDTCNKRFTQKSSLNTHKRVHTGERPYSCDICQKTFAVKSYVTAHRWSHVSEQPFSCHRCGLMFTSKNLFNLHIRTHTDQNHECHICGRTFMKDSYLIRHQNKVHRETPETNQSRSPSVSPPNTELS